MKGKISVTVFFLLFTALFLSIGVSCKKPSSPKAIITVEDPFQNKLVNCYVQVYSNPNGSIINFEGSTNESGQIIYETEDNCILNVKAIYTQNSQNLTGYGLIILKEGETYYETITVN
ncbi:MAG: hypothetical protein CVU05_05550 [Bacteroidetes bacterium HGW-Bacteroidetes-21]|jgi:hypothetical protein|nr:MAG: hypothetical protein CVU05_05550 [Bacteroidetes bacterium HGW-Bacteroidetes-21]